MAFKRYPSPFICFSLLRSAPIPYLPLHLGFSSNYGPHAYSVSCIKAGTNTHTRTLTVCRTWKGEHITCTPWTSLLFLLSSLLVCTLNMCVSTIRVLYLRQWALLGQGALVHVLEELFQSVSHCGVSPLLGWQILQLGTATERAIKSLKWQRSILQFKCVFQLFSIAPP